MSEYTIEKNVQIPKMKGHNKYPFGEMEPGDSFSFPVEKTLSVRNSAYAYTRQHAGTKFLIRARDQRCWRVS
jgi:hypothetical protein